MAMVAVGVTVLLSTFGQAAWLGCKIERLGTDLGGQIERLGTDLGGKIERLGTDPGGKIERLSEGEYDTSHGK